MQFVGVQLEFLQQRQTDIPGSLTLSLALFDIQDSEFSFESRSNQTKTVDFTTHAVIGYDTRYQGEDGREGREKVMTHDTKVRRRGGEGRGYNTRYQGEEGGGNKTHDTRRGVGEGEEDTYMPRWEGHKVARGEGRGRMRRKIPR